MPRDLVTTVHETYLSRYQNGARRRPAGEVHECGTITIASFGGAHPMLNMAFVFELPTRSELERAIEWITTRQIPFWLNVTEAALSAVENVADDFGLDQLDMVLPGMVLTLPDELPANDSNATVTRVTTAEEAAEYQDVFETVFDLQGEEESNEPSENFTPDNRFRSFVGRVDETAVATGGVYLSDGVANVFGMAVLPEFRGRGIGKAMCHEVLREGREAGCEFATLESTPMATPLYKKIGFERVVDYHLFEVVS